MLKKDILGHYIIVKRVLIFVVSLISYPRFSRINKIKIEGTEHLKGLPKKNVLFVSNHQTYFADVMAIGHVLSSFKFGFNNSIKNPIYILKPVSNLYYIAAEETMKAGWLPKLFAYLGSVSIKRTFREAGQDINRKVNFQDISNIGSALNEGWVITFPQGTTKAFAPGRRGTSHVIKKYQPIVVPVVLDGFRRAFDKKGLMLKKRGSRLSVKFKEPLFIDYAEDSDLMLKRIMYSIEQSEEFQPFPSSNKDNSELS
jgi:1-acyl-sn-glycerol-3-phosphate acyltransferase